MAASETIDRPQQIDLDHCVHCGLCLNACPTYRELGVEMDSPRGRIYQMVQVSSGVAAISPSYIEHIDLCLACRACETACPSGVEYGKLVEAARAEIETATERPFGTRLLRRLIFDHLLPSRTNLRLAGLLLRIYQTSGLQRLARAAGLIPKSLRGAEALAPRAEARSFYQFYGQTVPAEGARRYRVALLGGCVANICFARLNEATVRVLQRNGCEVSIPAAQTCCGALHVHTGLRERARDLARKNIDALLPGNYDAIITNAAGCGSTLKEYDELLEHDPGYKGKAKQFTSRMKDVNEFLASLAEKGELNPAMAPLPYRVTYQDSCHLAHGQKIKAAPRILLNAIPGITFKEMPYSDLCCGSAGIYNVVHTEMAMSILDKKMQYANSARPDVIATSNPGCMLQLQAGVERHGSPERVAHVVELLAEAYGIPRRPA